MSILNRVEKYAGALGEHLTFCCRNLRKIEQAPPNGRKGKLFPSGLPQDESV